MADEVKRHPLSDTTWFGRLNNNSKKGKQKVTFA